MSLFCFFRLWCGLYNHYDTGMHPKQSVLDRLLSLTQKKSEGEKHMLDLQRVSRIQGKYSLKL